MNILYHLPTTLNPINTGARQRIVGTLQYLKERSDLVTVDIVGFNPYGHEIWNEDQWEFLKPYCRSIHIYDGSKQWIDLVYCKAKSFWYQKILGTQLPIDSDYYAPIGYQYFVRNLLSNEDYDHLWINYLDFWRLAMVSRNDDIHKIIDIHDISCRIRLARRNIPHLQRLRFDYDASFLREVEILKKFDRVLVNSLTELTELEPYLGEDKLVLVPHLLTGLPDMSQVADYADRRFEYDLLFVGAAYGPNVEGMRFFLDEVFPAIVERVPSVKLAIAGSVCSELEIPVLFAENVECLGFVESLSDLYLTSRVVICPLRDGSGTKVKLQESMAYGVPIVTTTVGASGLMLKDGVDAFIDDDPIKFVNSVIHLLQGSKLTNRFNQNLISTYEDNYSRHIIYKNLDIFLGLSTEKMELVQ